MKKLKWFVFLIICSFCSNDGDPVHLKNIDCGSYVDYVPVDEQFFRYMPYYVELHRCHGANPIVNPQNRQCVPKDGAVKNVSIYAVEISSLKPIVLTVKNYTSCDEKCLLNSSSCTPYQTFEQEICYCECNYTDTPVPNPCARPFVWDKTACNCVCPDSGLMCEDRKEFNQEVCGCVCQQKFNVLCASRNQYIDQNTCGCIDLAEVRSSARIGCKDGVNGSILAVIMFIEAFLIIASYFVLYVYCYKRKYLSMKNSKVYVVKHSNSVDEVNCEEPQIEEPTEEDLLRKENLVYFDDQIRMSFYSEEEKPSIRINGFEPEFHTYDDIDNQEVDSNSADRSAYSSMTQV